ncbi:retrovirus-related pol polyprotein from transposon TNT 1-94 [Tanacetum coccineum]
MMCKPRSYYDEVHKVAIGYKNPLCLHRARQAQPSLYSGHVIITPNHAPAVVRDCEETLELSEISRKKMYDKIKANECADNKVNITPPNYSKENFLATFTPQKQLYPGTINWSQDIVKDESEALKSITPDLIKALTWQKAHNVVTHRCLELEAELSNLRNDVRKDNYNDLLNRFSNLEVNHLNLQLKYQNLKDSFQNKPSSSVNDTPDFNSVFVIGQMKASLQEKDNVIQRLKMQISQLKETRSELDRTLDFRARDFQISQLTEKVNGLQEQNELFRVENAKIKQHYKELYDSIKITRAKHTEQTSALRNENESLKVQLQNTVSCVTTNQVKPKVLAPGKYAIDVEPIPPRNRNNREVHLVYLRHLKESVDTLREIVEEAKVERPLDRSLAFACRYTKHSQELLEYVFGTCPKVFNQQDKKHAHTPRKKQVTFEDQIATSSSTTHKHVEPMHTQKSNVPVPPSTGVNSCTDASGSQPRSILKKHRIPPAKSDSLKKVEDHPRTIRSSLKTTNRVDSSISSKRTVINSNSHSVCQTCNKCLFSANHDMCVVTYLHSVNASPNVKNDVRHVKQVWKPKQVTQVWKPKHIKQIWKPTGKTLNNVGYQWRPTGRTFTLSDQCPLTRFTKLTGMSAIACANQSEPNQHWGSNFPNSPSSSVFKCRSYKSSFVRFGNDHFGAIMGYGDYVIGDSVISRVYYVEGLGHNLFSVGQFCDSDLEVAFRKHSCYVRDTDGVELLKGSRGSNLYTISVEDMMKSSPICLLSKASKHKSWLWHRRLNHLNFGTINDLARKDLVRGLPRLKFEKDHLCSACQLGKSKKHTHKPKTENTNLEVLNTLHMDLCGPMRVQTINGKKYILVIVDDYSRFTWVKFLRSKDETPAVVIKFLKQIQVGLNKTVRFIRTDNGTEFVNKTLYDYYENVGIFHQKTVPRSPQQNGVVERRNRTLVEAAQTMLIFSKAPMFLWAEVVATACYTQNRSLIYTHYDKTPYELVHNKKPDLIFFRVFGALCYPTNDSEDLGKLQPTADIGIFVGYAPSRKGFVEQTLSTSMVSLRKLFTGLNSSSVGHGMDTLSSFLLDKDSQGNKISQNPSGIFINQSKYANEILKKFDLHKSDLVDTPMVERTKLDEDLSGTLVDQTKYRSMIGLSGKSQDSTSGSRSVPCDKLVSWSSKKQTSMSISSIEAEYIAMSGCCAQILWMRSQLLDYGFAYNRIPLYYDNKNAIALYCNNVQHSRYGYVKYCKKSVKKRARERMSDQEAKEIKAEAREIICLCFYRNLNDKILVPEPDSSPCCARCGTPVDGPSCRGCAFLRKKFDEDLLAYCVKNGIFKDFQNTSESSDNNTNVVNALREPCVVNQDPVTPNIDQKLLINSDEFEELKRDQRMLNGIKINKLRKEQTVNENMVEDFEERRLMKILREIVQITIHKLIARFNVWGSDSSEKRRKLTKDVKGVRRVRLTLIAPKFHVGIVEADFDPNDDTSSDDDDFEDIEYISLEEVEQEEKKFDLEDIFQVQDVILREKLLNVHRLISNIKSLKVNSTPDVFLCSRSPSPFPIPVGVLVMVL